MLTRGFNQVVLRPEDLRASREDFEVIGVFNPGAARLGRDVVLLVRVAERPRARQDNRLYLPRYDAELRQVVVDCSPESDFDTSDPRVVRSHVDGRSRVTSLSHLRVIRSRDGRAIDSREDGGLWPETPWEEFGIEDPRITAIGQMYYITYVAVSRHGVATALASTRDFCTFERHGIIFCPENKDVVLFPETIQGQFAALHRPSGGARFSPPEMWLAYSPDLRHWGRHARLLGGEFDWESNRIGPGPPPVRLEAGWLAIYHGNRRSAHAGEVADYCAGAVLLDAHDPSRILARSREPLLAPETDFERQGFVPNVIFPTGLVESGDALLLYYGAADSSTAVVEVSTAEVLTSLAPWPAAS